MRIIAGTLKGRTLTAPTWTGLRPTSDGLRETIFNITGPLLEDATVLDLCAGTGALGLEALSRGARHVTFIDDDVRAIRLITANAAHCGVENRCAIIRGTAVGALADGVGGPFDLVLADPPYDAPWIGDALDAAVRHLAPGGTLMLEHAWRQPAPVTAGLTLVRTRRAGDSALTTYRLAPPAPSHTIAGETGEP